MDKSPATLSDIEKQNRIWALRLGRDGLTQRQLLDNDNFDMQCQSSCTHPARDSPSRASTVARSSRELRVLVR